MLATARGDSANTRREQARTANTTEYHLRARDARPCPEHLGTEVAREPVPAHTIGWTAQTLPAPDRVPADTDPGAKHPLDPADLPNADALICALAGRPPECDLCRSAYALVELHRSVAKTAEWTEPFRTRRIALVLGIDHWARRLPPPRPGARPHPESLGQLIDRLATAAASAFHLLMTEDVTGDRMHAAWTRLAELELDYADLLGDLRSGRRYLPHVAGWTESGEG